MRRDNGRFYFDVPWRQGRESTLDHRKCRHNRKFRHVDGTAFLNVRVENPPRTRMKCTRRVAHWWGCYVRPQMPQE
jgi:hypothetical protein